MVFPMHSGVPAGEYFVWIVKLALNRPYTFIMMALLILILSAKMIQLSTNEPRLHLLLPPRTAMARQIAAKCFAKTRCITSTDYTVMLSH
jgi:hypothetical protein